MSSLRTLLSLSFILFIFPLSAQKINNIVVMKSDRGAEIKIEREDGTQEIVGIMTSPTRIEDVLFISETEFCVVLTMVDELFYKKHYMNDEGFWRTKISYSLGINPMASSVTILNNTIKTLEVKILKEDEIIKIVNGKEEKIDLNKIPELSISRPKYKN